MLQMRKESLLKDLIETSCELIKEEVSKKEDAREESDINKLYKNCFYEIAKSEMEMLTERLSLHLPAYKHPITAIKQYRNLMLKANVYASIGEVKPQVISHNEIEVRNWKCSYHGICEQFEKPICIRGFALGYAVDILSSGKFQGITAVDFSNDGNCRFVLGIEYDGELSNIPDDEIALASQNGHVLTKEEKLDLSLLVWFDGLEKIIISIPGERARAAFSEMYEKLASRCIKKGGQIDDLLTIPISNWKDGRPMFHELASNEMQHAERDEGEVAHGGPEHR